MLSFRVWVARCSHVFKCGTLLTSTGVWKRLHSQLNNLEKYLLGRLIKFVKSSPVIYICSSNNDFVTSENNDHAKRIVSNSVCNNINLLAAPFMWHSFPGFQNIFIPNHHHHPGLYTSHCQQWLSLRIRGIAVVLRQNSTHK